MTDRALTDYTPSRIVHSPARNGYADTWAFYILPPGYTDGAQIPVGGIFGVVYSPNVFQPAAIRTGWRYIHFKVRLDQIQGVDREPTRYYVQQAVRPLTDVEQIYFERLTGQGQSIRPVYEMEKV